MCSVLLLICTFLQTLHNLEGSCTPVVKMKFENVLADVDGFGRFQIRMIVLMVIPRFALPFHFLLNNFIADIPSHHCDISGVDHRGVFRNLSLAQRLAVSIPIQEDGTPRTCEMFAEPQYHLLLNSSNMTDVLIVPCQNGWVYDNSTFASTLATQWDLVCDKKRMNKATATIFFTGVMIGAAVFGYLSDRFGRKTTLQIAYMTTVTFGFASAFAHNLLMFTIMRFFTGLGTSGISIITFALCVEWVDIQHRTIVGVLLSLDWSVGTILLSLAAYLVNDWRYLTAVATTPVVLAMLTWWWLPESARWLISQAKVHRAHFYLSICAKINHREQVMADRKPETLSKVIVVENESKKYSYLDLVKTPRMRRLTLLTGILWFTVACPYYGISLNISGFGVNIYLTQFLHGTFDIPAKILVLVALNKLGRRPSQAGTLVLTGLCIFCNIFIPQEMQVFRITVAVLGKMFTEGAFTAVFLYTAELYPTVLRQNGMGYCSFLARAGVSVAPLIMLLEDVWVYLPSSLFTLVALSGGLATSFLPETCNVRIPEMIEDVEQTRRRSVSMCYEKSSS
ncbi:solute carrier family 22 member 7-like [Thalassophryne amazonica]|uniref:solute carrier family 22 member 7-like n=1 Tax=Thalassophryne amazonica TaxID=390379 RepID=UPI001470E26B|nr:solute carrier family 22 member 7-like [Thalassophryne amazonica]